MSRLSAIAEYEYVWLAVVAGAWYPVVADTVNVPLVDPVNVPVISPEELRDSPGGMPVDEKD